MPSCALALTAVAIDADDLAAALRRAPVPVIARIEDDTVLLDLRTVRAARDLDALAAAVSALPALLRG